MFAENSLNRFAFVNGLVISIMPELCACIVITNLGDNELDACSV